MIENKKDYSILQFILLLYVASWLISPFLSKGWIWRSLMVGCISYFSFFCFNKKKKGSYKHFFSVAFCVLYIVIISLITKDIYQFRIGTIIFLLVSFCGYFIYLKNISFVFLKAGIIYIFCICILSIIITLYQLTLTPNICRLFAKNIEISTLGYHVMPGTGGYGFIYTVLLLIPYSIELSLYERNDKVLRGVSIIFLLTSYMLIIKAAYFLALLLSIIIILLYIILKVPNKLKNERIFFISFLFILFLIFFDYIIEVMIQMIPIKSIQEKILSLQLLFNGLEDIQDSEFTTRSERYVRSFVITLKSPIWGCFSYNKVGKHSHFLDISAQYGIPFLYGYFQILIRPLKINNIFNFPAALTCIGTLIILLFLNSLAFDWGAILFIFMPMYCLLIEKEYNYNKLKITSLSSNMSITL